jgi:hypothetical protein
MTVVAMAAAIRIQRKWFIVDALNLPTSGSGGYHVSSRSWILPPLKPQGKPSDDATKHVNRIGAPLRSSGRSEPLIGSRRQVQGRHSAAAVALAWLLPVTWLLLWGARFLEPGRVSLLLLLEVAVAAISAALLAGEPFGRREAAGCLLILAAGALEGAAELNPVRPVVGSLPPCAPAPASGTTRRAERSDRDDRRASSKSPS